MSAIDNLLNQLSKSIEEDKGEIQVKIKEEELTETQGDNIISKLEKEDKKINKTLDQLSDNEISQKLAEAQARKLQRRINKLNKQAGIEPVNMQKIGKAQPRPRNDNPNDVRCFIRYNNQGNPYRICAKKSAGTDPKQPPAQITPPIPVNEFLDKLGKTYGELTEGQRREYHRIDMANRRFNDRALEQPFRETIDSVLQEQRRLGGFIAQEEKLREAEERGKLKKQLKEIDDKYKELLFANSLTRKTSRGKTKQKLLKEAGLTDKLQQKFDDAKIKTKDFKSNIDVSFDIKDNIKKQKEVKSKIKKTKEEIKDGKKKIQNQIETGVNTKQNKKFSGIVDFSM